MPQPPNQNKSNSDKNTDQSRQVTINALAMAFGTMTSRVLGLVRDLLFASMFPPMVRDAWTAAFRWPNLFRRILGEGSLAVSFVPQFVRARVEDESGVEAQNLVNSFYTMLLVVLGFLTALGMIFPGVVLGWVLDPSYVAQVEKMELTIRLSRIMFMFIYFMSTYAFFMGILNALGKYALAAMAPTLFNVAMIVANLLPREWFPVEGDALGWGVVVGGFFQMAILIPSLKKQGFLPRLSMQWRNPRALRVWKNMIPGLLGLGLLQVTTIVNMRFASSLPEGSITYIYLADRLLELPLSLVSVSLGVALLPTLARLWSEKKTEVMHTTANYYMRLNLYIAIPAAVGLFLLSQPIVRLLFAHGHFTDLDAQMTGLVVRIYALILVVSSAVRVLAPSFYAIGNTKIPAIISAVCVGTHVIVAPILMREFGIQGLVASNLVSSGLNLTLLLVSYRLYIGSLGLGRIMASLLKFISAGAVMYVVLHFFAEYSRINYRHEFIWLLFFVTSAVLLGAGVYGLMSYLLKMEEFSVTVNTIGKKIKSKLGR